MEDLSVIQFTQFWRMFHSIVSDFDATTWKESGYGLTKPYLLAYHIIQSIKYYIDDTTDVVLNNGTVLKSDIKLVDSGICISQNEISSLANSIQDTLQNWIVKINRDGVNTRCKWTGDTVGSIIPFITRHSYFHLGEMNTLLNESLGGLASDHFATNIY
jgi:hypothetical protein